MVNLAFVRWTRPGSRLALWAAIWLELAGCLLVIVSLGWLSSDLREVARGIDNTT